VVCLRVIEELGRVGQGSLRLSNCDKIEYFVSATVPLRIPSRDLLNAVIRRYVVMNMCVRSFESLRFICGARGMIFLPL